MLSSWRTAVCAPFFLQALHMCVCVCGCRCVWHRLMLLTRIILRSCVTRLLTILNITNQSRLISWDEPVAICVSGGLGGFLSVLFGQGHLSAGLNIISSCFVNFCHNPIPVTLTLCVSVGVPECLFSPCYAVTHHDIDLRASFLKECSLRGPKVELTICDLLNSSL